MKTSVIMTRKMNGIDIKQDSKNQFFNANDVLDLYNKQNGENKRIQNYLDNKATKEYMDELVNQVFLNNSNTSELKNPIISVKRGKYGGTWMHPYLFIDFAMWLSPKFKASVIKWVYDNLISLRINSGDNFKEMNQALFEAKPNATPYDYANEASMINKLVFGSTEKEQRNIATEDQLKLLNLLQKANKKMIEDGMSHYDRYIKLLEVRKYL